MNNKLTFEEWEALYNALSTLEDIVLSKAFAPQVWEDIVKDGFRALAKLETPEVPNPLNEIHSEPNEVQQNI